MMKGLKYLLSVIFAAVLVMVCFFLSMDMLLYGDMPGFFMSECRKYNVFDVVKVEEEDLTDVSREMFLYLRGDRENLSDITTTVDGVPDVPFFNEKECLHMADCRKLFVGGFALLRGGLLFCGVLLLVLILLTRRQIFDYLSRGILIGCGLCAAAAGVAAFFISRDFYKYFVLFHETFFDNDLWILDVSTDRLLGIMPEGFFMDCVKYIGIIFGCMILLLLAASVMWLCRGKKRGRKVLCILLAAGLLAGSCQTETFALVSWPEMTEEIEAEGAILVDAGSGVVLYGKNMHESYYPASITKLLTALLVIENCEMDEIVEFSHRAVYDVESGSSSAGYDEGDRITVRTALHALLLKSANEAANALAEHVAGSIEAFCDMMNERAAKLGCTDSHFNNPSGLNDENHYTSAYDYALICREAFANDILARISGTTYFTLPASLRNPEPVTIYAHHNMLKKNSEWYYPGIIGGKTGYTSKAGNTLVTCVQKDGLKLIAVVLNGHQTHYSDTKKLLDFGFASFDSYRLKDLPSPYDGVFDDLDVTGLGVKNGNILETWTEGYVTVPKNASPEELQSTIVYETGAGAPEDAAAEIRYTYGTQYAGHTYLLCHVDHSDTDIIISDPAAEPDQKPEDAGNMMMQLRDMFLKAPLYMKIIVCAVPVILLGLIVLLIIKLTAGKRRSGIDFSLSSGHGRSRKKH